LFVVEKTALHAKGLKLAKPWDWEVQVKEKNL